MKKIINSIFIICLIIPNILFADDRNERIELMKKTQNEYENIKSCIWEYVSEQAKNTQNSSEQITLEALGFCDDVIEKMRQYNHEYIKLQTMDNLRSKGSMLYMADKQFLRKKEEWIDNIQNNINNIRNLDN